MRQPARDLTRRAEGDMVAVRQLENVLYDLPTHSVVSSLRHYRLNAAFDKFFPDCVPVALVKTQAGAAADFRQAEAATPTPARAADCVGVGLKVRRGKGGNQLLDYVQVTRGRDPSDKPTLRVLKPKDLAGLDPKVITASLTEAVNFVADQPDVFDPKLVWDTGRQETLHNLPGSFRGDPDLARAVTKLSDRVAAELANVQLLDKFLQHEAVVGVVTALTQEGLKAVEGTSIPTYVPIALVDSIRPSSTDYQLAAPVKPGQDLPDGSFELGLHIRDGKVAFVRGTPVNKVRALVQYYRECSPLQKEPLYKLDVRDVVVPSINAVMSYLADRNQVPDLVAFPRLRSMQAEFTFLDLIKDLWPAAHPREKAEE